MCNIFHIQFYRIKPHVPPRYWKFNCITAMATYGYPCVLNSNLLQFKRYISQLFARVNAFAKTAKIPSLVRNKRPISLLQLFGRSERHLRFNLCQKCDTCYIHDNCRGSWIWVLTSTICWRKKKVKLDFLIRRILNLRTFHEECPYKYKEDFNTKYLFHIPYPMQQFIFVGKFFLYPYY